MRFRGYSRLWNLKFILFYAKEDIFWDKNTNTFPSRVETVRGVPYAYTVPCGRIHQHDTCSLLQCNIIMCHVFMCFPTNLRQVRGKGKKQVARGKVQVKIMQTTHIPHLHEHIKKEDVKSQSMKNEHNIDVIIRFQIKLITSETTYSRNPKTKTTTITTISSP